MTEAAQLRPFAFDDHLVRVFDREGEPWFVLSDVCRVLEIANSRNAAARLDEDERSDVHITDVSSNGVSQRREMTIINESGLYSLVLTSRKPAAQRFKKWVTAEVLPTLRRTGRYEMASDPPGQEETESLGPLSELSARARLVEIAERLSGKPAARALWRRLGLPWVDEMDPRGLTAAEDDAVARFAVEGVERVSNVATPAASLWPAFAAFCTRNDLANPGEHSFFTRFGRMGFAKRKIAGRMVYQSIRPRTFEETSDVGN